MPHLVTATSRRQALGWLLMLAMISAGSCQMPSLSQFLWGGSNATEPPAPETAQLNPTIRLNLVGPNAPTTALTEDELNRIRINPLDIQFVVPNQPNSVGQTIVEQLRSQLGSQPITLGELKNRNLSFTVEMPGIQLNRTVQTTISDETVLHRRNGPAGYVSPAESYVQQSYMQPNPPGKNYQAFLAQINPLSASLQQPIVTASEPPYPTQTQVFNYTVPGVPVANYTVKVLAVPANQSYSPPPPQPPPSAPTSYSYAVPYPTAAPPSKPIVPAAAPSYPPPAPAPKPIAPAAVASNPAPPKPIAPSAASSYPVPPKPIVSPAAASYPVPPKPIAAPPPTKAPATPYPSDPAKEVYVVPAPPLMQPAADYASYAGHAGGSGEAKVIYRYIEVCNGKPNNGASYAQELSSAAHSGYSQLAAVKDQLSSTLSQLEHLKQAVRYYETLVPTLNSLAQGYVHSAANLDQYPTAGYPGTATGSMGYAASASQPRPASYAKPAPAIYDGNQIKVSYSSVEETYQTGNGSSNLALY